MCYEYLCNYLENLKQQLQQCQLHLNEQSQSYPIISLSLEQIDQCLREYVHGERNYLSTRNNDQLSKFKDRIHEKNLYQTIATYPLTIDSVSVVICIIS